MDGIPESSDSVRVSQSIGNNGIKEETRIPRPPNAFMLFGQQYRKVLSEKFEHLSNKQISKVLGEDWKKMEPKMKLHYHQLAEETHRKHLEKYPGYYYSPLEARQRKAERKLKSQMSRTGRKSNTSLQMDYPVVETFGGNRSFVFQNPMHAMMRPMFGSPIPPRMRFTHPMVRYGPSSPFGGFVRFGNFGFAAHPCPPVIVPITVEHNYAAQPRTDQSVQQIVNFDASIESNEVEVETDNRETESGGLDRSTDMELLSDYLPPMHNPNNEVTPVANNSEESVEEDTNDSNPTNEIKGEVEVTRMSNASVGNEPLESHEVKEEPIECEDNQMIIKNAAKVVVKRCDR